MASCELMVQLLLLQQEASIGNARDEANPCARRPLEGFRACNLIYPDRLELNPESVFALSPFALPFSIPVDGSHGPAIYLDFAIKLGGLDWLPRLLATPSGVRCQSLVRLVLLLL